MQVASLNHFGRIPNQKLQENGIIVFYPPNFLAFVYLNTMNIVWANFHIHAYLWACPCQRNWGLGVFPKLEWKLFWNGMYFNIVRVKYIKIPRESVPICTILSLFNVVSTHIFILMMLNGDELILWPWKSIIIISNFDFLSCMKEFQCWGPNFSFKWTRPQKWSKWCCILSNNTFGSNMVQNQIYVSVRPIFWTY